jgi:thiol-disulfide isomerase/thioredoxin
MFADGKVSPPGRAPKQRKLASLLFDVLAGAFVAFAIWKMVVAPNLLHPPLGPSPTLRLPLLNGGTAVVPAPGRVLFLDFWATWCFPCRVSLPLVEAYARAHPEVDVIPVNVGESTSAVAAYAREHGLRDVALDRDEGAAGAFGVAGFPTMVVIDAAGRIRAKWEGVNPAVGIAMDRARRAYGAGATSP